jgi:hypothetical protein
MHGIVAYAPNRDVKRYMDRKIELDPDIIAEIQLLPSTGARGGKGPVSWFGCPIEVDGEYFDCRISLAEGPLQPGETTTRPIAFLFPQLVLPILSVGSIFSLWEAGTIGHGKVIEITRTI